MTYRFWMTRAGMLAAVLAACTSSSVPLDKYDDELLQARCQRFVRCGLFVDDDSCQAYFRVVPDPDRKPAIDAGKLKYDGDAAKRCNDAIAAQTCDGESRDGRRAPDVCAKVFVGQVGDGDACQDDLECASARCNRNLASCEHGACCAGTCASSTKAGVGEQCANNGDCTDDEFCAMDMTCHALGKSGDTCFNDVQCDFGLACAGTGFPKSCVTAAATGSACPDARCADIGAACPSGTCVAAGLPGANTACTADSDCSIYALCDTAGSHVCVAYPTLGMACDPRGCAGDAFCDSMTMKCTTPLAAQAPCTGDFDCESEVCVEGPVFDDCQARPVCI